MPTYATRRRARIVRSESESSIQHLERRALLSAVPLGGQFQVDSGHGSGDDIAMDSQGNHVIVWSVGSDSATGLDLFARRFDAAGAPLGDVFRVNVFTTGNQHAASIAMNDAGDFVIVWESGLAGQDGDGYGIYARRYNAAGQPQGGEVRVNSFTLGDQRSPSVAMEDDGDCVVGWNDDHAQGAFAQRYNAAGAPQGGQFGLNGALRVGVSSIAMDADGDFVVTGVHLDQSGDRSVYARLFDAGGAPKGGEFRVNTYMPGPQMLADAAMHEDGAFVIVWQDGSDDLSNVPPGQDGSGSGVYAQRYDADGVRLGGEFRVNTHTTHHQSTPSVAIDGEGNAVVAWRSHLQDGHQSGIYAQRLAPGGTFQGPEFRVNSYTTDFQISPSVALADHGAVVNDGNFLVVWSGYGPAGYGVFAQHYTVALAARDGPLHYATLPHEFQVSFNANVSGSLGVDDLVMENLTTGQTLPQSEFTLAYEAGADLARFTYTGAAGGASGRLAEGRYRATLLAEGITAPGAIAMQGNPTFDFHFMVADANNDGLVNLLDFNALAGNFGQSGTDFRRGDFNYDGVTNLQDFNILAMRFGAALPSAPAVAPAMRSSSAADDREQPDDPVARLLR